MSKPTVRWYPAAAKQIISRVGQTAIESCADGILNEARGQLEDGNHLDTHFLWQSGYTSKPGGSSSIAPDGVYASTKTGDAVQRVAAQPVRSGSQGAVVGFAASYALEVEERYAFLYQAIEKAKGTTIQAFIKATVR